ncbi:response regulator transcription factor [Brochothrix thermosphacta]|uniref:Putative transcriptional regulator (Modular protein) n=1 Tax=Brochothrix thermosphacta TaxID=2756 RepID=A0A2X0SC52_BROTH|nr:response regulator transcription factor [Brochothrix thermosphacta]SPP29391.1 putative transcriptional regulator (modular protein) [Brochothrix thermosphacta]
MATIKILLVEDDILLAGSIAKILEEIGNVTHCNDGEEGLYEAQYGTEIAQTIEYHSVYS